MADNQRWFNHILKNKLIGATKVALIFINYTKSIKGENYNENIIRYNTIY